jgi:type I restriction enzyme S subunit
MTGIRRRERLDYWFKLGSGDAKPKDVSGSYSNTAQYPIFGGNGVMGWTPHSNADGENIIIGRVGANCGCVHYYNGKCWITDNALYTKQHLREYDKKFMALQLTALGLERLRSKTGQPLVSQGPIHALQASVPSLPEQVSTARALLVWDIATEKMAKLIAAKQQFLDYLRDHHLAKPARAVRLKLHTVTRELVTRNGTRLGREAIMAVTKQIGMRPMRQETIAANIERYKLVPPNGFAYNPMRLNIGSIAMSPFNTEVLVSPDYVVFECDESRLIPGYLNHVRRSRHWKSHFETAGNGSVRVRIYYDDLGAFSFELPPVEVQAAIVRLLDAAALEMDLLHRHAELIRVQKRGLMQKLLTGEWRLSLPQAAHQKEVA